MRLKHPSNTTHCSEHSCLVEGQPHGCAAFCPSFQQFSSGWSYTSLVEQGFGITCSGVHVIPLVNHLPLYLFAYTVDARLLTVKFDHLGQIHP